MIIPMPAVLLRPGESGDVNSAELGPEGYLLEITEQGPLVTASGPAGRFYAAQTLKALGADPPPMTIVDKPQFAWRGVMLDVARHFMPKEFVLRLIDRLAAHKLNVLHLHLTDDQGWRLQIERYPRLAQASGEHFTKADAAEIVAYAAQRFITVVPEIEMPGHAQAALAAYPELGNHPEIRLPVWDRWGINDHVFNLEESTITFLEHVLDEVVEVFPGPYVHLGGDECPTKEWEASQRARQRITELGLPGPVEACSWFIGRLAAHLRRHGRKAVYWDEPHCPPVPGAAVMIWREEGTGRSGPDIILTPHTRTYLDYYPSTEPGQPPAQPGVLTLDMVYDFDPDPGVLGVQAQLWTEYMPAPSDVERMAFPRLCAFSEVAWGSPRDYPGFLHRLDLHRKVCFHE